MKQESTDFRVISLLTAEQAHTFRIVPEIMAGDTLQVMGEPAAKQHQGQLELLTGMAISLREVSPAQLEKELLRHYPYKTSQEQNNGVISTGSASDIVRFFDRILDEAVRMKASDIHFERYENDARIRFRWEGQLIEKFEVETEQYNALISRLKIMADLDISERRLPQDGRIHIESAHGPVDIRVSTLPGKYGEKAVLRLLLRSKEHLQIDNLSLGEREMAHFMQAISQPNGIILITGPTGSGKTTTLYATLNHLNRPDKNLLTVEDPVEYNLRGINQLQVKDEIGLTFDRALRAFLRQDPDIIMVGEIRDGKTAQIAIRAALTGHLVFSTLHTNSAWDAVIRLQDMGIPAYLLASSLRMVIAQRLVRVLCRHCRKASEDVLIPEIQDCGHIHTHYLPVGCQHCHYTGYQGRRAVFEILPVKGELTEMIRKSQSTIRPYLQKNDLRSLSQNLITLIQEGVTSLEEAFTHWTHEE